MKQSGGGYIFLLILFVFFSCDDEKIIVPDNNAPLDPTVSNAVTESYINKTYISLLGRKAQDHEYNQAFQTLTRDNLSQKDREIFVNSLFAYPEYKTRVYELARGTLVQGASQDLFLQYLVIIYNQMQIVTDPFLLERYQEEFDKLYDVYIIDEEFPNNQISVIDIHKRLVNNLIYDEINMGAENYVISVFQNLLLRNPTDGNENGDNELENAKLMVDGVEGILFLEIGNSKNDFIEIFFNSNHYFEGQVRELYNKYLFRDPNSFEMTTHTLSYKQNKNYQDLQLSILTTDEYIGID